MNTETASTMIRAMRDSAREIEAWPGERWSPVARAYARGMADAYTIVLGILADDIRGPA